MGVDGRSISRRRIGIGCGHRRVIRGHGSDTRHDTVVPTTFDGEEVTRVCSCSGWQLAEPSIMNLSLSEARIHSLSASAAFLCPSLSLVFFCRRPISTVGKLLRHCVLPHSFYVLSFIHMSPCVSIKRTKKVSWQHLVVAATTTTTRLSQKRRGYLLFFHASFIISRGAVGFGVWVAGEIDFSFLFSLSGVFYSGCI